MRGLFATMLAESDPEPPSAGDDYWYAEKGSMSNAGRRVTPDLAMRLSAVYCSVNLLAKTVGSLPLRMYQKDAKGNVSEAPNHPLNELLEYQPNKWQTAWDFKALLMFHLLLRGNAYAEIIAGPRGFADQLQPIHPDRIPNPPERLPDGSLRYKVLESSGTPRFLLQDEILHLRSAVAPGGLVGISPVTYARETIGLALAAEEHGARLFSNGARPSGVVQIKKTMSDPAFARFKAEWAQMYTGLGNVNKTPILEEGAEFKAISLTAEDAQFLATRQFQIEEIARWFDIPLVMLHHMTNQTSWGTGVEAIMLAFVRNNLMPWLMCWTQAIRRDLILAPNTYEAKFDVEQLIAGDSKAKAEFFTRLTAAGILTRNEAREALGYNPLPGLDEPIVAANMTKSDNLPTPENSNGAAAPIGLNGGPPLADPQHGDPKP